MFGMSNVAQLKSYKMSRITKDIASAMAKQLTESQSKEISQLGNELTAVCRQLYIDSLPAGILLVYKKWMEWFDSTSSIIINGPGLTQGYKYYNIGESLPKNKGRIEVDANQADDIVMLENKITVKKKEYNELKSSIEAILFNLRTYKNVCDKFPEAAKYLPAQKTPAPIMITLKDIRCKLDKANC